MGIPYTASATQTADHRAEREIKPSVAASTKSGQEQLALCEQSQLAPPAVMYKLSYEPTQPIILDYLRKLGKEPACYGSGTCPFRIDYKPVRTKSVDANA